MSPDPGSVFLLLTLRFSLSVAFPTAVLGSAAFQQLLPRQSAKQPPFCVPLKGFSKGANYKGTIGVLRV